MVRTVNFEYVKDVDAEMYLHLWRYEDEDFNTLKVIASENHRSRAVFPLLQGGPHMHTIAALGIAFHEAMDPEFKDYAAQVVDNARAMAAELTRQGFELVSGGTDNHLMLVRLNQGGGILADYALEQAGIIANRNSIPDDPSSAFFPSGIRFGTPAITTRGFTVDDTVELTERMAEVLRVSEKNQLPASGPGRRQYMRDFEDLMKRNPTVKDVREYVTEKVKTHPTPGFS